MTLMKREIFPSMSNLFDNFFNTDFMDWDFKNHSLTNTTLPAVNIMETSENFVVEMAAPGMEKQDFDIQLDNGMLTISSEKEMSNEVKEDDRYTRREFSYQSFKRTFQLPKAVVDESKIKARYENGILNVTIPKKDEAKSLPPKKIKIS